MNNDVYSQKPWLKHYDKHVAPTLTYENKSFAEKFSEIVQKYPDKTALIYMGAHITFKQLDELSNRLANYLLSIGILPNDVVGLHLPNIPAHYMGVVAVQKAGAVSTGLSPLLTPSEMEHQLNDSKTKVVITLDILFEKIAEVSNSTSFTNVIVTEISDFLPAIKRVLGKLLKKIPTAPISPLKGKEVVTFMDCINSSSATPVLVKRNWDDIIFMMYTGGTT